MICALVSFTHMEKAEITLPVSLVIAHIIMKSRGYEYILFLFQSTMFWFHVVDVSPYIPIMWCTIFQKVETN